jgi:pyruvate/2-oxoglutarate dehydrogenase complex dihydrolipoamide dehydrogenase (E3) component/uncharacterized membrane protein YdjX (TVP38/TMEM64 family)
MQKAQSKWGRYVFIGLFLALIIGLWTSGVLAQLNLDNLRAQQGNLSAWTSANPLQAALIFVAIYVLITAISLPGAAVMTLAGGAIFGLVTGTVLVSFASSVGALLAMLSSRYVFRDALTQRYGDRIASFNQLIQRDGAFYLFTLRLVPVMPFFLVNLLAGLVNISAKTFYWVSQLGMLPGTIVYVFAGTQLAKIRTLSDIVSPGLLGAFALLGLLPWLMRGLSNWMANKRIYKGHQRPKTFDYNLIVIGAGSAGLVSAYIAAAIKAKVALIERHRMGGDCLNTGCVPSKALLRSAKALHQVRKAEQFGIQTGDVSFDFAKAMQRVQDVIQTVAPHDSIERYTNLGVEVITGDARLVSPWEVAVNGKKISARSVIIASGARPLVPAIPGLDSIPYLTSDSVWDLKMLPKRLLVLGGGPIGCELAQCFQRFGSAVTIVEMAPRILPREDADAAAEVRHTFLDEGMQLACGHKALRIEQRSDGSVLVCEFEGGEVEIGFDTLLLALGRKANVEGFGLQELGIEINARGTIQADALMRTNFPNIHVCGDVAGPYQFTHVAAHQAWYASVNALLAPFWSFKADYRVIPWATFCEPEVARVGLSEDEAKARGIAVEVTKYGIDDLDRAIADSCAHGFVKVLTVPGKDRILGALIVGDHAGELLTEFVSAMKHNIGLNQLLGTIHTYPTMAEANKYVAGLWKRAHAPQTALKWAEKFFAWRR